MVIALIGEFCNKWLFGIFDSIVSLYGADHFALDAFTYRPLLSPALTRSMMSCVGSLMNVFQTGWLYNFLIKKDFSIPTITSWGGIVYGWGAPHFSCLAVAMILCVGTNKPMFIVGGVLIIVAYASAAPTAPSIFSVGLACEREA